MREFRILGPLEIVQNGSAISLSGQKQRALLAVLLLRGDDLVPSERLIEELWGESPPKTAATSLQNLVSQLRKALGHDVVETRPPGYRLRVRPEQVDLGRFEMLVRAARMQSAEERVETLGKALALWRGEPLVDFVYEPFAQNEIRRLEELRLGALEDRFDAQLELGRGAELVGELEAWVRENPLRERLRGQLMLALYRSGRQADALQEFHELRHALVDELGIEPSPELQRLHQSILRQETRLERAPFEAVGEDHYADVVKALFSGRLVPVLGPDVASPGPSDVVEHLAKTFDYPEHENAQELTRVAQYVATMTGIGPLYDALHELYADVEPRPAHTFVASLGSMLRARGVPYPLVVTTGYDLALERAFADAGEDVDVVVYAAFGRSRGRFWHLAPNAEPTVIEVPNTYASELSLDRRTVILKLHGCVDTDATREWESFVITEDDYIDYLAHHGLANLIPIGLTARLRRSHFLFLGYALRDWNLRVLLNRLWGDERVAYRSWAVQPQAPPLEVESWRRRDVDVYQVELDEYVSTLERRVDEGMA